MNNLPIQTYEPVVQQRDALLKQMAEVRANAIESLLTESFREEIAGALADFDGMDEKSLQTLIWSGQPPEPDGDVWCVEYMTRAAAIQSKIRELMEKGVDALQIPESFKTISENIRTQDKRATSHPLFAVMQKREIVVDGEYDHDRFVWVDEEGQEASDHQKRRLDLFIKNFREPPEKWRHLAVKEINEFVTACFTEQGCKDYLDANGHNLRHPFIYVFSAHRNAEFIAVREWLAKGINDAQ